ncbi:MAG: Tol-Pal system protein TolB, partial [Gammaproteobacteria bacterium]
MRIRLKYLFFILVSIAMPVAGFGALIIEITEGVEGALPVAVVPFDTSELSSEIPVDVGEIITND